MITSFQISLFFAFIFTCIIVRVLEWNHPENRQWVDYVVYTGFCLTLLTVLHIIGIDIK